MIKVIIKIEYLQCAVEIVDALKNIVILIGEKENIRKTLDNNENKYIVNLEEVITIPILPLKKLRFRGEIRSHRKQVSEPKFDLKAFYSILLP